MSQQDGLDVQCERQGIRKHDSTSSGLNKWKNDLLFIETGKTVRTGLFLMGEMKGGIRRRKLDTGAHTSSPLLGWSLCEEVIETSR